ncbi:hypothetical protein FK220_006470 [Flavobacteriaceae bacterium TP-CH-4]|uniref:Uncharacterized protein n=1 Tax=Pelagihabitans pacificus TaxID=2696054 RepID=A0A967ATM3_9FLAO|nr:hypothetical protein [Pelagihabitans pacificus]NHF58975.1 hypothetical protein [Pelagihabitans pacificus]
MNDLFKRREAILKSYFEEGPPSGQEGLEDPVGSDYERLKAYLVLLYQYYLQRETILEPDLQMALWRFVQLDETYREKIALARFAILKTPSETITGDWETSKNILFPLKEGAPVATLEAAKEKMIAGYKEIVWGLLER